MIREFFDTQLNAWDDCRNRYKQLQEAESRIVTVEGRSYTLMFNPARMRSATAKVVGGKVERPCFLCRHNRPEQQKDIDIHPEGSAYSYALSVNPFPILPYHFTIINSDHCRQTMTMERLKDMEYMARTMEGFLVFFNGACSGASAPDHFHFQAVPAELVPLTTWNKAVHDSIGVQKCEAEQLKISFTDSDNCNILCWNTPEGMKWWVVNRRQHRPWQYSAEGDKQILISPASLEFAGVVPLAREEDYRKMTSESLNDIFTQCWNRQPLVDVGIMPLPESTLKDDVIEHHEDGTFTLRDVTIGIGFHWERHQNQRFEGELILRQCGEQTWAVNRLPVERYLTSVISSEMSATSSIELLKAHAVISRSWLLAQLAEKSTESKEAMTRMGSGDTIIKWYDHDDHQHFDVCADDHCQRYQGISSKMNPVVLQAIKETEGEVLMYDGDICDARFSKCCGGITEEYQYCWDNKSMPYLKAIRDAREDGTDYCNTHDKTILQQVLNDYDQETPDFYEWQVTYTRKQLSELIERKMHFGLGEIQDIISLERGKSGRICLLRIVGSERTIELGKELEIRKALSESHLYSSWFDVNVDGDTFILNGRGWGHGVGLCQIGAAVMSAEGKDYREILTHYYKNAEIKKIW